MSGRLPGEGDPGPVVLVQRVQGSWEGGGAPAEGTKCAQEQLGEEQCESPNVTEVKKGTF